MLVGSGGVVALVLGAWSTIWALRILPRTSSRGWWPVAVAWITTMVGFALISSFEETLLGLFDVVHADPEERVATLDAVRGWWLRPLGAAAIGALLLAGGVVLGGSTSAEPVDPDRIREPLAADRIEMASVAVAALLLVVDLGLLAVFAQELGTLEATLVSLMSHAPSLEATTRYGIVTSSVLVGVGTSIGAWRGLRAWRARRA